MRVHTFKTVSFLISLLAWFLLPWISVSGAIHSKNEMCRIAAYLGWAGFGIGCAYLFFKRWRIKR